MKSNIKTKYLFSTFRYLKPGWVLIYNCGCQILILSVLDKFKNKSNNTPISKSPTKNKGFAIKKNHTCERCQFSFDTDKPLSIPFSDLDNNILIFFKGRNNPNKKLNKNT